MNEVAIGEIASVRSGYAFKSSDWVNDGISVIKITNVKAGRIDLAGCSFVSESVASKASEFELRRGDILISMTGYIGEIAVVKDEGRLLLNQRVGKFFLRRPDLVCSSFLYYAVSSPAVKAAFIGHGYGSAQPNISPSLIEKQKIPLPSLSAQRRIASILSAYDDLIENNRKRIAIVEEMARRLYREWFVHFRYPGHESVPLIDSPLGPIPQGWNVASLGTLAEEVRDGVTKGCLGAQIPHVGLEHIPRRKIALDAWDMSEELGSNKLRFEPDDLLFAKIRPYFHKASVAPVSGVCSADTIVIRSKRLSYLAITWAIASSDQLVALASATANGAKMPRTDWPTLAAHPTVLPTPTILGQFSSDFIAWVRLQQNLIAQNAVLRRTRDLLLPRLMSGTLSVETLAAAEAAVP